MDYRINEASFDKEPIFQFEEKACVQNGMEISLRKGNNVEYQEYFG